MNEGGSNKLEMSQRMGSGKGMKGKNIIFQGEHSHPAKVVLI